MTGIELIEQERTRQIEVEGHDNDRIKYAGNELEQAASAYENNRVSLWPWGLESWKPTPDDPVRQLVKAGALYQAEADRISDVLQNAYSRRLKITEAFNRCLSSVDRCALKINNLIKAEQALKEKEDV